MKKEPIVRHLADALAAIRSETDWRKTNAMTAEEADRLADEEDGLLPDGWEKTIISGTPESKEDVHIRLDSTAVRWFKAQGP